MYPGLSLSLTAFILQFILPFSFLPYLHVSIVTVFSGTTETGRLKLGIHMGNELLSRGIENRAHCFYSSLYLSVFMSFQVKFVSQFSQELCKHGINMENK